MHGRARPQRDGLRARLALSWLQVLRTLGTAFWSKGCLLVSRAGIVLDQNGALTDPKIKEQLATVLRGVAAFARASRRDGTAGCEIVQSGRRR